MIPIMLRLLKTVRSTRRALAAGDILFRAGEPAQALFHVERGAVALERDGVRHFVAAAGQPFFAEAALFAESYAHDAVALDQAVVVSFPKAAVLLLLRAHPDLNLAFSAYLARQADRLRLQAELLRLKGAPQRVLGWLAAHAAAGALTVDRPLTEIAAELGLTREALYRTLAKLEQAGRITRQGKRTFVLHATP
jgi:cAMP-binding proteins - catabolite gene activator and regulatory subunit of cAMP-dependent protein kinases